MRIMPKTNPWPAAVATSTAGMPKTSSASATATSSPLSADTHTRLFNATKTKKRVSTGSAATAVESSRLSNGSYSWGQVTGSDLRGGRNLANRRLAKPFAQLREVQTAGGDVPVERLDMAVLFRRVLQRDVEDDGVDPDVSERVVLRRRRFLHEEVSLAVPEHRIGSRPADVDVLPEPRGERCMDVVVQRARRPLFVRLARRKRSGGPAVEKDVAVPRRLAGHERVPPLVGVAALHQCELPPQREREPPRPHPT